MCTCECACVCIHVGTRAHAYVCTCMRVCVHVCAHVMVFLNLECPSESPRGLGRYSFLGRTPDFLIQQSWVEPKNLNF